jgi:hypothetical protein
MPCLEERRDERSYAPPTNPENLSRKSRDLEPDFAPDFFAFLG